MASTFLYSTVWKFLEPDELVTMFDEMVQDANVRCTYMSDKQIFRIEFPEPGHDQTYFKFVDLCNDYIEEHQDGPQDAMSDPKIFRPAETGGNADAEDELEELLREDDMPKDKPLVDVGDPSPEDEDDDKPFWSPKDPSTDIALVLPDRLLQEIAQDTTCSLDLNVEKARVFITNATASKIQTVTRRLDNIERNSHRPRIDSHFIRTEKETNALLQLHRLQHLQDGTLLQTLTPDEQRTIQMLPRQRVVRLMRPDSHGRLCVFTSQPSSYTHSPGLVEKFVTMPLPHFIRKGMHDPLVTFVDSSVEEWVQGTIDSAPEEGDLLSGGIEALNLGGAIEALRPVPAPFKQPVEHSVQDLGFPDEIDFESRPDSSHTEAQHDSAFLVDYEDRPRFPAQAIGLEGRTYAAPLGSIDVGSSYSSTLVGSTQSRMTAGIRFSDRLPRASWDAPPARPVPLDWNVQPVASCAGDDTLEPFPPLGMQASNPRVPCMQPRSSSTLAAPPGLSTLPGQYSQMVLTELEEPTDVHESIQIQDEVASRIFFKTTAHRKPKSKVKSKPSESSFKVELDLPDWDPRQNTQPSMPKPSIPKPSQPKASRVQATPTPQAKPLVLPEWGKDILQLLDHARSYRGYLDMEISIGRILIEGLRGPEAKEFAASRAMSSKRMAAGIKEHLSADEESVLHFVERLTSSTIEACQIPTPNLFHEDAKETSWYEFYCEDKNHNQLIVRVNGPDDVEVGLLPTALGQIFFHYPKRRWDARFAVNGREPYTHRKAITEFLKKLSAEFRDSKDGRLVDLRFLVTSELKITSAYIKKRLSLHHISNDLILLHLTEVQDLYRGWMRENTSLHQFVSRERTDMIASGRLWFEAKLSVSSKSLFDQNPEMKIGDDAAWNAKDVLDDKMLSDIQDVVDRVVIRMDGVGVQNKGWRGSDEDLAELEEWEQKNKMSGRAEFW
ncbi:hypothetical protein QM012_001397 [Aureobasidium pullulans]|uniref:Uncharacterized protein n=1 Tax=Aureobasidium pullulans TaxID=5580 RepID=A0ABR0TER5_AURPU